MKNRNQRQLRLKIIVPIIAIWILANTFFFQVKLGGAVLLITGILELFFWAFQIIFTVILLYKIIKDKTYRNALNITVILLSILLFAVLNISLLRFSENTLQSNVVTKACYEGTMNTSKLFFRKNGEFEDYNIGFFALVSYTSGTWKQNGDTIYLEYDKEPLQMLGTKILIKHQQIFKVSKDSIKDSFYYVGDCKGLN